MHLWTKNSLHLTISYISCNRRKPNIPTWVHLYANEESGPGKAVCKYMFTLLLVLLHSSGQQDCTIFDCQSYLSAPTECHFCFVRYIFIPFFLTFSILKIIVHGLDDILGLTQIFSIIRFPESLRRKFTNTVPGIEFWHSNLLYGKIVFVMLRLVCIISF